MRGLINAESSEINMEKCLSLMELLGNGVLLETATEAYDALGGCRGILELDDVSTVFGF